MRFLFCMDRTPSDFTKEKWLSPPIQSPSGTETAIPMDGKQPIPVKRSAFPVMAFSRPESGKTL